MKSLFKTDTEAVVPSASVPNADPSSLENELQYIHKAKEGEKLFLGCLDLFDLWSPIKSGDATVASVASGDTECSSGSSIELQARDKSGEVVLITNDGNYSSRSIILHSTISYTSVEEGDIQDSVNFNGFLPIERGEDAQHHSRDDFDNRSELSFSYSSFSEDTAEDMLAMNLEIEDMVQVCAEEDLIARSSQAPAAEIEDMVHDYAEDVLARSADMVDDSKEYDSFNDPSFDPSDFLEDNDDFRAPQRLGTIMECHEEFSSRSFQSRSLSLGSLRSIQGAFT